MKRMNTLVLAAKMRRERKDGPRKSEGLEKYYARQGVWHLSLRFHQLLRGVLPEDRVRALVGIAAPGLKGDVKREQPIVTEQPLAPKWKVTFASDPNFRVRVGDVWIHVLADGESQNCLSAVEYKPRGRVIPAKLDADVMIIFHEVGKL